MPNRLVFVALAIIVGRVTAEGLGLKFLNDSQPQTLENQVYNTSIPVFQIGNSKTNRLCVSGKWIFYNKPMYGNDVNPTPKDFLSFLVPKDGVGYSTNDSCYHVNNLGFQLSQIHSIRAVSTPYTPRNSITIFPRKDFFGKPTYLDSNSPEPKESLNLGSLIVNKMQSNSKFQSFLEICSDTMCLFSSACINFNSFATGFSVRDTSAQGITLWPKVIRKVVGHQSADQCSSTNFFISA